MEFYRITELFRLEKTFESNCVIYYHEYVAQFLVMDQFFW